MNLKRSTTDECIEPSIFEENTATALASGFYALQRRLLMVSYQDDRSRFIMGAVKIYSPAGENAMSLLDRAAKRTAFQSKF